MPLQVMRYMNNEWKSIFGKPGTITSRDNLVSGEDKPTFETAGLLSDTLDPVYGDSNGVISLGPGTYMNKRYWGRVVPTGGPTATLNFINCEFVGTDPDTYATLTGMIMNGHPSNPATQAPPFINLTDCRIDGTKWTYAHAQRPLSSNAVRVLSPQTTGIHGGNFNMQRSIVTGVQDGINYTCGSNTSCTIEKSILHKMHFVNNWFGPSDGRSHSDVFQFNRGKNITIRGNILGGQRDMVGYRTWPGGYNSGDDAWNAAFMIKQEVSNGDHDRIENVLIEKNWIYGGTAGINFPYNPNNPNLFETTSIINNRFGQRGSGWRGSANGAGTYDTGDGWYIIRSSNLLATISGNINESTGLPVPITNG